MNPNSQPPTLDLLDTLARHKRPMFWTFSLIMAAVAAVTFLGPKTYTSDAKLFVRVGRETASLDPTATTGQTIMVHEWRDAEILSVIELLKSRDILQHVSNAVGPQIVLEKPTLPEQQQVAGLFSWINTDFLAPYSVEDEAIKHLAKKMTVQVAKKSNVINVSYEAKNPELARDIVARVIDQARETHIHVNRTHGSQEFFASQAEQLRHRVNELETRLRTMKDDSGIASLPDQRLMALQQIADLESALLKAEAELTAVNAELTLQKELLAKLPETVTIDHKTGVPQTTSAMMREHFYELQVREKEILAKHAEAHPAAVLIRQQVEEAKKILDQEPDEPQVTTGPNRAHQEMTLARLKAETSAASLAAHVSTLRGQLATAKQQLAQLNAHEIEVSRLQREIDLETANYKKYAENLEQARIDSELEATNISSLNVLQEPTYSVTPTRPRRAMNLGLGLFGALAASLAVGLCLEQRRSRFMQRWLWQSQGQAESNGHVAAEAPVERS
jgi:uncharacterized protein involved in exopolysaccharide biosynthesis